VTAPTIPMAQSLLHAFGAYLLLSRMEAEVPAVSTCAVAGSLRARKYELCRCVRACPQDSQADAFKGT
jgi:hypothetical protein